MCVMVAHERTVAVAFATATARLYVRRGYAHA